MPLLTIGHVFAENGTPFIVGGTGTPLRQFIYSRDLAKLFIWQMREYDSVEPVILSGALYYFLLRDVSSDLTHHTVGEDEEITIRQVADAIVKAMDFKGEYAWDATKADGQYRKPASNKKLISLIGDFQFTPFEEGAYLYSLLLHCDSTCYAVQLLTNL